VENYLYATSELSQTTLRSIQGQAELDELLAERDRINRKLQQVIDQQTDPWGIKVSMVEVKHLDLPETMKRAMARQAESERERRAKVIHAEGEFQAAARLRDAAVTMEGHPMAMQMRFLQTLADVGTENNTTVVLPVPVDLLSTFLHMNGHGIPAPRQVASRISTGFGHRRRWQPRSRPASGAYALFSVDILSGVFASLSTRDRRLLDSHLTP